MVHLLARHWWALALRGLLAVLFGILTLVSPGLTLFYLVLLFGAYAILEGIFNIISAIRAPGHHWPLIVEGIIGIIAGVLTFMWPGITAVVLLYLIAFWAIFTGVLEITAGIRLRQHVTNEWMLILMGITSVLFGALILISPGTGALAIALWIGVYALIFGVILIVLAFRLRPLARTTTTPPGSVRAY
ncbi:MAG: HdeD family acid-resistance protein [Verrucomicrobia bacterium]|nr:HdeD family acid-resistance protein [Verrucomicrobiota bacterium]